MIVEHLLNVHVDERVGLLESNFDWEDVFKAETLTGKRENCVSLFMKIRNAP